MDLVKGRACEDALEQEGVPKRVLWDDIPPQRTKNGILTHREAGIGCVMMHELNFLHGRWSNGRVSIATPPGEPCAVFALWLFKAAPDLTLLAGEAAASDFSVLFPLCHCKRSAAVKECHRKQSWAERIGFYHTTPEELGQVKYGQGPEGRLATIYFVLPLSSKAA